MESNVDICCDQKLPPWFMSQNLESNTKIFYTLDKHQNYVCRVKELQGRRVRACFHGWLILSDHPDNRLWSLWNPLASASNFIRLPPLTIQNHDDCYECCLSAPPPDQASVLLLTTPWVATIVFCRLHSKRKRFKWIEMSYAKQLRTISGEGEDDRFLQFPTCCNGKVYAMTMGFYYRYIIQIQIDIVTVGAKGGKSEEQVVISLVPFVEIPFITSDLRPSRNRFRNTYPFLRGSCTDLFYIQVDYDYVNISRVYLFKLDMTSMMWNEMADLEDAIFILQVDDDFYSTCYYSRAELGGGYIHILCDSSRTMYSFHAKDRTISVSSMPGVLLKSQASASPMLQWRRLGEIDHSESTNNKQEEEPNTCTEMVVKGDTATATNTDTTGDSHLLNMPLHILELIMEHCVGVEYLMFRATCKLCHLAAAPSIQWNSKKRLQKYSLVSPWLMVLEYFRETIMFIDPILGDRYFINMPQQLKDGYKIYCSRYGWLLLYKNKNELPHLVFYNPFTGDILELQGVHYLESFCFSAPPTSPDCMVVGFTTYGPWHVYIRILSQESTWGKYGLNFGSVDPYSYRFPTFSGTDMIYALCNNDRIEAFRDLTHGDDYCWEAVADKGPSSRCRSPVQYFLTNCDQHLLLIIIGRLGESVEVFKLTQSIEWEKIHNLEQHMVFISDTSCICLEAKSPEMGNKIYFPILLDTRIVFYSLETCRYHTFDDSKNIQESFGVDLFGTKHHYDPRTWIEPSWS